MDDQMKLLNLLIIEDKKVDQEWIRDLVRTFGIDHIEVADTCATAIEKLKTGRFNTAIVDLDFPDGRDKGLEILEREEFSRIFKIILTIWDDYFSKALLLGARRFMTKQEVNDDADRLRLALLDAAFFVQRNLPIFYQSDAMGRCLRQAAAVARRDDAVLIVGESGSGKELVARAVHELSSRAAGSYVTLNCACLDPTSAESDLFGVSAGGFTGTSARPGVFERAHRGTVFLDEIGELGLHEQPRMLRILEHPGELIRAGGHKPVLIDGKSVSFRVICATDKDLNHEVIQGKFHGPLYQRISRLIIEVPPLNERRDDIPILAGLFLRRSGDDRKRLSDDALSSLRQEDWTERNVRGLWNVIARAVVFAEARENSPSAILTAADIQKAVKADRGSTAESRRNINEMISQSKASLNDIESAYIEQVLRQERGRVAEAAKILGLGRNTLYEKIRRYKLDGLLARRVAVSRE